MTNIAQLTRMADAMHSMAEQLTDVAEAQLPPATLTEEPPVGSMVTTEGGLVARSPDGWQWLNAGRATWDGIRTQNPHLTTDAERKEAGISDETDAPWRGYCMDAADSGGGARRGACISSQCLGCTR